MIVEIDWASFKDLILINRDNIISFMKTNEDEIVLFTHINGVDIVCKPSIDLLGEVEEFSRANNIIRVKDIRNEL